MAYGFLVNENKYPVKKPVAYIYATGSDSDHKTNDQALFITRTLGNRFHYIVQVEAARLLAWWIVLEAL